MRFVETRLAGAYVVEIEPHGDDRGFFSRTWCQREFEEHGLMTTVAQSNLSFNSAKGTVRGMHWQAEPHPECKVVRCVSGAIFDVIVDLRESSPTYLEWLGVELSGKNRRSIYIPKGFAHGLQTLSADTEVLYLMSEFYVPGAERGLRPDDPAIDIDWPLPVSAISERDSSWPDFLPRTASSGRASTA